MAVDESHNLKRTLSQAQLHTPSSKKLHHGPVRHHRPKWNLQRGEWSNTPCQDDAAIQSLLTRSISLALEAVGFEAAAPDAIESFRMLVEEYMAHYVAEVRLSMLSCRRNQAIPQDFLQALHTHQLSLRSLLPHLDPPVSPERSQFKLEIKTTQEDENPNPALAFLGPMLNSSPDEQARTYIPKHFPDLPSKHTYKATSHYPEREQDPRKIRERATEEGRLGEEALRRLVGAGSEHLVEHPEERAHRKSSLEDRNQLWREAMQAVSQETSDGSNAGLGSSRAEEGKQRDGGHGTGHLRAAVNADKKYWRKPAPQRREGT